MDRETGSLCHVTLRRSIQALLGAALLLNAACSPRHWAVDRLGDTLAGGGSTFSADDDPELVRDAAPFSLKLMEGLLAERPHHRGLLLALARGFTQYGYAFVQTEADVAEDQDYQAALALRQRARGFYLRARDYGLRGLDAAHPGFSERLRRDPEAATQIASLDDMALLYWTAASWGAAVSVSKDAPALVADLPLVEALAQRALALDEGFEQGAIHVFFIAYEAARPGPEAEARARVHFDRAVALSEGRQAAPFVSLAEAVSLRAQARGEFVSLPERALAIDPAQEPNSRLANRVLQRRARWLLGRIDRLFAEAGTPEGGQT
jgi:predicted anti-sigma-YlaC factor YlaD